MQVRQMRMKVVADVVEALTGAFFITGNEPAGFAFVSGPLDLLPIVPPLPPPDIKDHITSKSVRHARDSSHNRPACIACSILALQCIQHPGYCTKQPRCSCVD